MGTSGRVNRITPRLLAFAILTTLAALFVRLPTLKDRPFHTDEAVNAFILQDTFAEGFVYRAEDHHGPTLYYLSAALLGPFGITRAAQMETWMLRLIPAVCGSLLAGAVYLFFPYIRAAGAIAASVFFAVLAPFVYYSGEFIHESLFVLLLCLYFGALWRTLRTGSWGWAVGGGTAAGLMLATKETAGPILVLITISALLGNRFGGHEDVALEKRKPRRIPRGGAAAFESAGGAARPGGLSIVVALLCLAATALIVVWAIFGALGRHLDHALDLFRAVSAQVHRGTRSEHAYPWWQYVAWFAAPTSAGIPWSGWLIPGLAAIGWWSAREYALTRAFALSAALLFAFFSALPYKTPWLMLAWEFPLVMLAGLGFAAITRRTNFVSALLSLLVLALLGHEMLNRCHRFASDPGNPLAYSPTSPDLDRLEREVDRLAGKSKSRASMLIQVVARDYWPTPWALRQFERVGFWSDPPERVYPGLVLLGPEYVDRYANVRDLQPYTLRPGVFIFLGQVSTSD